MPGPGPDPNIYFGQPIVPVVVITIVLSTLSVALRFWSRAVILRTVALEDAFILLAWVSPFWCPIFWANRARKTDAPAN